MASTPKYPAVAIGPVSTACGLLLGAAYVGAVDPARGGGFVPCPLHATTGLWCPGCGLTRATHHLLHGELITALRYNALVGLALPLIVALWAGWYAEATGRPRRWRHRVPERAWIAAIGVSVLFAIARNLPWAGALRG